MEKQTLKDVFPQLLNAEFAGNAALKHKDVEVLAVSTDAWPGHRYKHVTKWVELANERYIGLNENPTRGIQFVTMQKLKDEKAEVSAEPVADVQPAASTETTAESEAPAEPNDDKEAV